MSLHNDFAVEAMDKPATMDLAVELNTFDQLYEQGINAEGVELDDIGGSYTERTIKIKNRKGQRVDHVTLRDTGYFYDSMKYKFDSNGNLVIEADTIKEFEWNGEIFTEDLQDRWGKNILGLTDSSLGILKPINRDNIIKDLRKFL